MTRPVSRRRALIYGLAGLTTVVAGCTDNEPAETQLEQLPDHAEVVVYWFWGETCPLCTDQRSFIDGLQDLEGVVTVTKEIYSDPQNQAVYEEFLAEYEISRAGVPATFIGDTYWLGDSPAIRSEIEDKIETCLAGDTGCIPPSSLIDY